MGPPWRPRLVLSKPRSRAAAYPAYLSQALDRPLPAKDGGTLRTSGEACDYKGSDEDHGIVLTRPSWQPKILQGHDSTRCKRDRDGRGDWLVRAQRCRDKIL